MGAELPLALVEMQFLPILNVVLWSGWPRPRKETDGSSISRAVVQRLISCEQLHWVYMLVNVRTNQVSWCLHWQTFCCVTVIPLGPFSLQSHNFWKKLLACFSLCCQWKDIQILFSRFFPSSISLLPVKLWLPLLLATPPRSPPPPPSSGSQATLMNCLLRTAFAPSEMIPSGSHLGSPALLHFFSKFSSLIRNPCPEHPSKNAYFFLQRAS